VNTSLIPLDDLRADLRGRMIVPEDPDYDRARTLFYGGMDRRPAAIARVADAADVSRMIRLARETGLELAVRSGGHSLAGHSVSDGGIVIDLSDMRAMEIDVEGRTAWTDAGLTTGEYTDAAAVHGLATGFGDSSSVGVGGITLGGGVGFLVRKHGLTIDDLLAAELVTADGELLRVDAETHPDLFWAIRGGGGNFGVATRVQLRLHQVGTIVGGLLILPATADTIASFISEAEAAPEELTAIANVMPAPPMPLVPEEHHGRIVIFALLVHAGDVDAGERAVAPFRSLAEPIADMVKPMPYPGIYLPEEEDYHPIGTVRTLFLDRFERAVAETILEHLETSTGTMAVAQLRVLGGAVARVPADATAFAHRSRPIMAGLATLYEDAQEAQGHEAWATGFADALGASGTGAYVNFLGDEGEARVREAYPGTTWDRLREIKRRYDPANLFRLNQNIPPAAGER
jgi:FAD/FMN-containing dehydrogenase